MYRPFLIFLAAVSVCAATACGDPPTAPTTSTGRTYEKFAGTLNPGESQLYSFSISVAGSADVTFLSLVPAGNFVPALTTPMAITIGTLTGITDCTALNTITVSAGLLPQLTIPTAVNTYCVTIADTGNLLAPADFVIRILRP